MKTENLMPISAAIEQRQLSSGSGRHESISEIAKDLNATISTIYRWVKSDDHFICRDSKTGNVKVFKQVKELSAIGDE